MTFLNLSLLAGTALVALPIVLHLIMRQKPRLLEFPALQFIQRRHETNRRRLQLRHLLLLLLRCAVIVLLGLALARPRVEPDAQFSGVFGNQEEPVAAALVYETAPHMQYRHENRTRLEAAQELGEWLISQLPADSQIAVLDTRSGPAVFQVDALAAKERILRLESVANSRPVTAAIDEALHLLKQSELPRKELYIFTDMARAAWPVEAASALQARLAELRGMALYVVDVGIKSPTNFALAPLRLSGQVLSSRSQLRIETLLSHVGPGASRSVELRLIDSRGNEQKVGQSTVDLGPNQAMPVSFVKGGLEIGTHQGLVRIVGQDALSADDTRYFTVEVKPAWRILIAAPKPTDRSALYLTEALAPALSRLRGDARFECDVVDFDVLATRPLDSYAAICLLDPRPLEPNVWKRIGDFAADGHGVAIFLGRNAAQVESFNDPIAQQVLAAKLLRQARAPEGDVYLAPRNDQHPVLAEFRGAGTVPWNYFPVMRYWELDSLPAGVGVIVPYNDGRPALLERPLGKGRVLTMTTPISDDPNQKPWNLLPVGSAWPFVILANQIASYLVGSGDEKLNYFAGQTVVVPLAAEPSSGSYVLTAPNDLKFPVSPDPQRRSLVITATEQVGNYRLQTGGNPDRGFSVNFAAEQTSLERLADGELDEVFATTKYRMARTREEIERDVTAGRVGRELYPALIVLVAVVLALEHLVSNRFYKS